MFIELPALSEESQEAFNVIVNTERVMWGAPMREGERDFTRLFMNVADNSGRPAELDVDVSYDKVKAALGITE